MKKKNLIYTTITIILATFCINLAIFANDSYNLTILETNDTHSHLEPFQYKNGTELVGGIARRATLINSIKKTNNHVLLLDAGDFSQGTLYYNLYKGYPDLEIMQKIGYDAIELGNHEFDNGIPHLEKLFKSTTTPILCANIKFKNSEYLNQRVKPYIIKDINGLKVGITGVVTGNLQKVTMGANDAAVYNNVYMLNQIVKELHPKTDVIVVLSHCGFTADINIAQKVPNIDVIAGGHSHTKLNYAKKINDTLIIQSGEYGLNLASLDLNIQNHTIKGYKYKLIPINSTISEDFGIKAKITELSKEVNKLRTQVIGNFVTPIELETSKARTRNTNISTLSGKSVLAKHPNVSIVAVQAGNFRASSDLSGNVSKADLMELIPFDNTVVIGKISGYDLKRVLEKSARFMPEKRNGLLQTYGIDYKVHLNKYYPNRISDIKINNIAVKPTDYFTLAITDFLLNGGDGYSEFKYMKEINKTDLVFRDAIIDYICNQKQIDLKMTDNIQYINNEEK